jgi:adenylate cyclase
MQDRKPDRQAAGFGAFVTLLRRRPFLGLFGLIILSNAAGSFFNIEYNQHLVIGRYMDDAQKAAFVPVMLGYNVVAYGAGLALILYLLLPLMRCRKKLLCGEAVAPGSMEVCRRRLVNLPFIQVCVNFLFWIPGAVVFPWLICLLGGTHNADAIWVQFMVSFFVSAGLTTVQTFFLVEAYLMAVLYPDFFQDARPAEVQGVIRISFPMRLFLLWSAVALMPLVALLAVVLNFRPQPQDMAELGGLARGVAIVGIVSGGLISWIVGRDLFRWVRTHAEATEQIAQENFDVRVAEKRPDEWGRLTDRFNDMAVALGRARQLHETFGVVLGPEVRDEILDRYPGGELGGEVQEVTVLFADIRGFTRRSAGEPPERVVELLNQFLTLAVRAVEDHRGMVNKFLGDGIMALFGAPRPRDDHADRAIASAVDMLRHLVQLNQDLLEKGQASLTIGIGIHTGPALVGCVGVMSDGKQRPHKEFTAIGETVNLCQRIEQLTKTCGSRILLSEQTRLRLRQPVPLVALEPQEVPGCQAPLLVHALREDESCSS